MSRCNNPLLAWLTWAIGSPVMKWTTVSSSSDSYGWPQRRMGMLGMVLDGGKWNGRAGRKLPLQYTPTVVASASSRNGRTPLMPSQGYLT